MSKVGAVTGGIGDIVYSIPVMRKLGITTVYVKENFYPPGLGSMYTVCKPLLEHQGIECLPTSGAYPSSVFEPGLRYDYDLDAWRCMSGRDRVHIIKNMCLFYRVSIQGWNEPWLWNVAAPGYLKYNLVFLTQRWRENSRVDWKQVIDKYGLRKEQTLFMGHPEDYERWKADHGIYFRYDTPDLLHMAYAIAGCEALYCNQGVALTIAQGLGKPYWLEVKPGKSNTLMYTKNEHIL